MNQLLFVLMLLLVAGFVAAGLARRLDLGGHRALAFALLPIMGFLLTKVFC